MVSSAARRSDRRGRAQRSRAGAFNVYHNLVMSEYPRGEVPRDSAVSVFGLIAPVLERWPLLVWPAGVLGIAGAIYSLLAPPMFLAASTFTPQAQPALQLAGIAGLAGLADQLNLAPLSGGNASPDFYAALLRSRELISQSLRSAFTDPAAPTRQRPLLEIMRVHPVVGSDTISEGVRRLQGMVDVIVDRRTAVVTLRVRQRDRHLAADVANRMVELVNAFNLEKRRSQSREQTRFTEERLQSAGQELRDAEDTLLRFLVNNRTYRGSPLLEFEAERLQRQVSLKQEVYATLAKALEESRIAEVRDTPLLTVLDRAVAPDRRTSPRRMIIMAASLGLGLILGLMAVYLLELGPSPERIAQPDVQRALAAWRRLRPARR